MNLKRSFVVHKDGDPRNNDVDNLEVREPMPFTAKSRTRIIPSSQCGYGPGQVVAQYFDPEIGTWFDIGDPVANEEDAQTAIDAATKIAEEDQ